MKFEVNLPDNNNNTYTEKDMKAVMASALYDKGICSLGYAAESVGLSYRELIEGMGKFGIPVLKMSKDEFEKGIENAKQRAKKRIL